MCKTGSRINPLARRKNQHPSAVSETGAHRVSLNMEQISKFHIEELPDGLYLATSEDIPGLIAQGRTIFTGSGNC